MMPKLSLVFLLLLATAASAQTKTPVLVELFTSEGCSSCPAADQLLIHLDKDQPVTGADLIVLGEHVDYWDRLGWRDRFSSARFTDRQQNYAARFRIDGPYTPQMVVNGTIEFVGNDSDKAYAAIQRAAMTSRQAPAITMQRAGDHIHIRVDNAGKGSLGVLCAVTERGLSTRVGGGENRGRELRHTAVVRQLTKLGQTRDGRFEADVSLKLASDWRLENLRAVVFLQRGNAGEIASAAQLALK